MCSEDMMSSKSSQHEISVGYRYRIPKKTKKRLILKNDLLVAGFVRFAFVASFTSGKVVTITFRTHPIVWAYRLPVSIHDHLMNTKFTPRELYITN